MERKKILLPVHANPLCRWSKGLRWATPVPYAGLHLGMEGCGAALNATNCIRSCLYFGANPPTLLNARGLHDINSLEHHTDDASVAARASMEENPVVRFERMADPSLPTVVMENFVDGARSIEGFDFPESCNLIAGHENRGVSTAWLKRADHVVFVPQYGTISSMNVVSCAGVGLYHYHLSRRRALLRHTDGKSGTLVDGGPSTAAADAAAFCSSFGSKLPLREDGTRLDARPIHPSLYLKTHDEILRAHADHTHQLLAAKAEDSATSSSAPFRLGVLYENDVDTRNLGGLVRNANSYVAPVFYVGKRRINKQGSVGSNHYTELVHLARMDTPDANSGNSDQPLAEVLRRELLDKRRMEVWELALDQDQLWPWDHLSAEHRALLRRSGWSGPPATSVADVEGDKAHALPEVALDGPPEILLKEMRAARRRSPGGVVIYVPQEGLPPGAAVLQCCSRRIRLCGAKPIAPLPHTAHRGVPSQVGAAVALERLFSYLLHTR